jgi:hypothetical protein
MLQQFIGELEKLIDKHIGNIHTALPGEIVGFDTETCLASVQPKAQMHLTDGRILNYPVITGVPIVFPQSGTDTAIAYPVKKGDGCLIIVSEQALDYWMDSGTTSSELKHDLTNAIAIPGLFRVPLEDVKEASKDDAVIIRKGVNKIKLTKANIAIRGDVSIEGNLTITKNLNVSQSVSGASGEFSGDVEISGKSFTSHTHISSEAGSSTSAPE